MFQVSLPRMGQSFRKLVGKHSPKTKVLKRNTTNKWNVTDNLYNVILANVLYI